MAVDEAPAVRYIFRDCDGNEYYITVTGENGIAQEIFTTYEDENKQDMFSKLSNMTGLTRLSSVLMRISGNSTDARKQLARSSRRKNDIPDILRQAMDKFEGRDTNEF